MPSSVNSFRSTSSLTYLPSPVTQRTCMTAAVRRYRYLRKLSNFKQMDFEFALWQMTFLFINPQKVYRNFQHRKETKLQFARDDPAFLVLLSGLLCVSSVAFTYVLRLGFVEFLKFLLYIVTVDCLLSGVVISSVLWLVANRYLIKSNYKGQDVEWAYAFDIHLNAFVPTLVISHIFQLFFYHIFLRHDWFLPLFIGNTLWLIAIGYYLYITFLGYSCLPILQKTEVLLTPFILLFFLYTVLTMVLPLLAILILPKLMNDPETKKEMEQLTNLKHDMPEMSEVITSFFTRHTPTAEKQKEKTKAIKSSKKSNKNN